MKRKLIKQGAGGCVIYVPKKWLDSHNLGAGDSLNIKEEDNMLVLSSEIVKHKMKETSVNFNNSTEYFVRIILNDLYRLGYDKIKVNYKTKSDLEKVKEINTRLLLGFDITAEDKDFLVIENIVEPSEEKFEVLFRKMFFILKNSLNLLKEDLSNNSFKSLDKLFSSSRLSGRYNNFCKRTLIKKKLMQSVGSFYWSITLYILLAQHTILHLYEELDKLEKPVISESFLDLLNQIIELYDKVSESFFGNDFVKLEKANKKLKNILLIDVFEALKKSKDINSIFSYYLGELSRMIYLASVPMVGVMADKIKD